jgi:hypothetical protein
MEKQTPVEWLALRYHHRQGYLSQNDIAEAKAMEKEQIIDFAMQMHKIDCSKTGTDILLNEAELYYNKTYNK